MAEPMVRHQPTPNPNAAKFTVPGHRVAEGGSRTYTTRDEAESNAVAAALLELDGVASVFMVSDFITVTKEAAADWNDLVPRIVAAIRAHL